MATTNLLGITLLEQAQAQKEITINQALSALDAATTHTVLDKDLATPPVSPVAGDRYIVAASATGAWAGKSGQIAFYDQGWRFITPSTGVVVYVADEAKEYRYNGTSWGQSALTGASLKLDATNTAAGTTSAQTINKPSGTVNFAAGASSLVVTNSLCTTSSIVFAAIRANDATAVIKNVVPAAGSFTITLDAATTAETSVGFMVIN